MQRKAFFYIICFLIFSNQTVFGDKKKCQNNFTGQNASLPEQLKKRGLALVSDTSEIREATQSNFTGKSTPLTEQLKQHGLSLLPEGEYIRAIHQFDPLLLMLEVADAELMAIENKKWMDFIEEFIQTEFDTLQIDINNQDELGNTKLHYAVTLQSKKLIKYLLEKGANPLLQNKQQISPFLEALSRSIPEVTPYQHDPNDRVDIFMIDHIKNINIQDTDGNSLLMIIPKPWATWATDISFYLMDKGINIHLQNNSKENALLLSIDKSATKVASRLIKEGADIHAFDKNGINSLMRAVHENITEIITQLAPKMDVNFQSQVTKQRALDFVKSPQAIRILIDNGADLTLVDNILHSMIERKNFILLIFLINETDVNVNFKRKKDGNTPLHLSVMEEVPLFVQNLLSHKNINIYIKNNQGKSPLDLVEDFKGNRNSDRQKIVNLFKMKETELRKQRNNNDNIIPFPRRAVIKR